MALLPSPTYGTYYRTQILLIPAPNKRIKRNRFHLSLAALLNSSPSTKLSLQLAKSISLKSKLHFCPNEARRFSVATVHSTTTILSAFCFYLHYLITNVFHVLWHLTFGSLDHLFAHDPWFREMKSVKCCRFQEVEPLIPCRAFVAFHGTYVLSSKHNVIWIHKTSLGEVAEKL